MHICVAWPQWVNELITCSKTCMSCYQHNDSTWWRHQMETFSALPALCAVNSPVTGHICVTWPQWVNELITCSKTYISCYQHNDSTWWRHQMETFSRYWPFVWEFTGHRCNMIPEWNPRATDCCILVADDLSYQDICNHFAEPKSHCPLNSFVLLWTYSIVISLFCLVSIFRHTVKIYSIQTKQSYPVGFQYNFSWSDAI